MVVRFDLDLDGIGLPSKLSDPLYMPGGVLCGSDRCNRLDFPPASNPWADRRLSTETFGVGPTSWYGIPTSESIARGRPRKCSVGCSFTDCATINLHATRVS